MPSRSCVACRTVRAKRELIRVVRTSDARVVLDSSGRLAGRGAYLCADGSCWTTALDKGTLTRALRASIPPGLRAQLAAGPAEGGITGRTTNTTLTTNEGGASGQE